MDIPCIVLEKSPAPFLKPGETLPPNAFGTLQQLGVDHLLQASQHDTCIGNTVIWGNDDPGMRYFFAEPYGNGWHIDRAYFEQQLCAAAIQKGAVWLHGWSCLGMEQRGENVFITGDNGEGESLEIEARFGVDASGRSACLARKAGVNRHSLDRLTGYYTVLEQPPDALAGTSFIEAVEDGWWYAAPLKNGSLVTNFMTDADIHKVRAFAARPWLFEKLRKTRYLKDHLRVDHPGQFGQVRIKPASTSCLERLADKGWLAVGDAACTYDPVSSFGITAALGGSLYAALAIKDYLDGKPAAIDAYCYVQQKTFNNCMAMLGHQYGLERRWKDFPFWQRRHAYGPAVGVSEPAVRAFGPAAEASGSGI